MTKNIKMPKDPYYLLSPAVKRKRNDLLENIRRKISLEGRTELEMESGEKAVLSLEGDRCWYESDKEGKSALEELPTGYLGEQVYPTLSKRWLPLEYKKTFDEMAALAKDWLPVFTGGKVEPLDNLDIDRIASLADDSFKEWMAQQPAPETITDALMMLAKDKDSSVRECLAKNDKTPAGVLKFLSGDKDVSIRSAVAQNPNTSPEVLAEMSADKDDEVIINVAGNPHTPADTLVKLFKSPMLSRNLVFVLTLTKNPNLPIDACHALLNWLFRRYDCWDYDLKKSVAENPRTPTEILAKLAESKDYFVQLLVAENPSTPATVREKLAEILSEEDDEPRTAKRKIAEDPNTPAEVLAELARDPDFDVREDVARNPNAPAAVLSILAEGIEEMDSKKNVKSEKGKKGRTMMDVIDRDMFIEKIIYHPNATPEVLLKLGEGREALAENPATPGDVLAKLADDPKWWIRKAVAANPSTPIDVLEKLAEGVNSVKGGAATNPNLPTALLLKLSEDEDVGVRMGAASNPAAPADLLERLSQDESRVRECLAANPSTPVDILIKLSEERTYISKKVATNPNINSRIFDTLFADQDSEVCLELTRNPSLPLPIALKQTMNLRPEVRRALIQYLTERL